MTISGRFLQCLLERRVVFPTVYSSDITASHCPLLSSTSKNYGNMIKYVLLGGYGSPWYNVGNKNIGSIAAGVVGTNGGAKTERVDYWNGRRMIPGLWLQDEQTSVWNATIGTLSGDDVEDDDSSSTGIMQVTGKNVMEWIYNACEMVGGTIQIDASGLTENLHSTETVYSYMILQLTEGEDKSDSIIFSDKLENIASLSYSENYTEYSSFAHTYRSSDGSWAASHAYDSSSTPTGFDRREIFVSSNETEEESDDDSDAASADSSDSLKEEGLEALMSPTYAAEAELIVDTSQYVYGTDYKVGDIVTIRYDRWDLSLTARLTGMIESFDQSGRTLTPTFNFNDSLISGGSSTEAEE